MITNKFTNPYLLLISIVCFCTVVQNPGPVLPIYPPFHPKATGIAIRLNTEAREAGGFESDKSRVVDPNSKTRNRRVENQIKKMQEQVILETATDESSGFDDPNAKNSG